MNRFMGTLTLILLASATGAPLAADEATFTQRVQNGIVYVHLLAPAGGKHWQPYYSYTVPTGVNLNFTDGCPSSAPNAVNGAFSTNLAAQAGLSLVANYRGQSNAAEWKWAFKWPSGAPAGSQISFSVYCARL